MLTVQTYLDRSPIHGLGLYAAKRILRGTLVWTYQFPLDYRIPREGLLAKLPPMASLFAARYWCFWGNEALVNGDDARFMNHCDQPNVKALEKGLTLDMVAVEDIEEGEEITTDYRDFDDTWVTLS